MAYTFSGGLDLQHSGKTPAKNVTVLTGVERLTLTAPDDAELEPCVSAGDHVAAYGCVGSFERGGARIPVYSALSGKIERAEPGKNGCITVIPDGSDEKEPLPPLQKPAAELSPDEVTDLLRTAAVPCRGSYGYAFERVRAAAGGTMRFILNCCESEPGVYSRRKLIEEDMKSVIDGAKLLMIALDVRRCEIAVEKDAPYYGAISAAARRDPLFEIHAMKRRYPQDEEVAMIYAVTGTRLSDASRPERSKCCVFDAETAVAAYRAAVLGVPYCERIVTFEDNNVLCPVGAPISALLDFCGVDPGDADRIIDGGPMRGRLCKTADDPIGPLTDAVTVFYPGDGDIPAMSPCTRCGRCVAVCPSRIMPYYLAENSRKKKYAVCDTYGVRACTECGCCDYVCPAYIPIKRLIRTAKLRVEGSEE